MEKVVDPDARNALGDLLRTASLPKIGPFRHDLGFVPVSSAWNSPTVLYNKSLALLYSSWLHVLNVVQISTPTRKCRNDCKIDYALSRYRAIISKSRALMVPISRHAVMKSYSVALVHSNDGRREGGNASFNEFL